VAWGTLVGLREVLTWHVVKFLDKIWTKGLSPIIR
jgi:hypothetical protein